MKKKVFLSHNSNDKPFVRRLAQDLDAHGILCWIDEAELSVGDSLIGKIREGLDDVEFVAVIVSPNSIKSKWVEREIDVASNMEIAGKNLKILPILLGECELPGFLLGKFYADFKTEENYEPSLELLVKSLGVVFNKSILRNTSKHGNLATSLDAAWYRGLPVFSAPFHRPFQYLGLTKNKVQEITKGTMNEIGSVFVEDDECKMHLMAEGNFITFVEVDIKRTGPHNQNTEFDSVPLLGALSISLSEVELAVKKTHYHYYYDHKKKLKISVSCLYDGAPLTISFGTKYYGM